MGVTSRNGMARFWQNRRLSSCRELQALLWRRATVSPKHLHHDGMNHTIRRRTSTTWSGISHCQDLHHSTGGSDTASAGAVAAPTRANKPRSANRVFIVCTSPSAFGYHVTFKTPRKRPTSETRESRLNPIPEVEAVITR